MADREQSSDPVLCVAAASLGNTLGGMSCYWIGTLGKSEWITRLGVSEKQLARARRFLAGRGALMAFFAFLPTIGEAIANVMGMMRFFSNRYSGQNSTNAASGTARHEKPTA